LAPSVGTTWSLLPEQKSRTVTGDQKHPLLKKRERMEHIWGFHLTDLNLRAVYLHPHAVIL